MSQQTSETAVRKSVTVDCSAENAFRVFTDEVGGWWPFEKIHSIAEADVETVIMEGREGGRFYERTKSGQEHLWGTVLVWDPPRQLVCSWHPGRGEETAQRLEITFTPEGNGTRVDLVHTGWERLEDGMEEAVAGYNSGWETVLGRYVEAANGEGS
jgi:uncharacterized protein YndB with AHSA1/START domain